MKKIKAFLLVTGLCLVIPTAMAQSKKENNNEEAKKRQEQMLERQKKEAAAYYANADTAAYGIRYLWTYAYDTNTPRKYQENRVVWVSPKATMDMSYQSIGEKLWMKAHAGSRVGGDSTLAYRLTPSFYFYYPETKQLKRTYRIISDEFLLEDKVVRNDWTLADEEKTIGGYHCKKASCLIGGRKWTAWYTTELPYVAAPRNLVGLPGVVLEASDEKGEICWQFQNYIACNAENRYYVKYPDKFSEVPIEKFPLVLQLFARSTSNYLESSKVMNKTMKMFPEKLNPATGIDACVINNPIELK